MNVNVAVEYLLIKVSRIKVLSDDFLNDENNAMSTSILDYAGYIIVNKSNNTQKWSPHFYNTLGYESNEIMPSFESLEKIMNPSDFSIIDEIFRGFRQNINRNFNLKLRYKTKSRTHIVLNSSIKIISNKKLQLCNN